VHRSPAPFQAVFLFFAFITSERFCLFLVSRFLVAPLVLSRSCFPDNNVSCAASRRRAVSSLFASVQLVLFQINQVLPAAEVHPHQTGRGFLNDSTHAEALLPPRVRTGVIERPEGTLFPGKPDSLRGALCGREERPEEVPGNCLRRSGRAN